MTHRRPLHGVLAVALIVGAVVGCEEGVPVGRSGGQPPLVSGLVVQPDSINAADVPADRVQDSLAQVLLRLQVRAEDSDGRVERVQFTIEPSSNPRATATGRLQEQEGGLYGRRLGLRVPVARTEVYTIRVFAVDDDSLASNQSLGQFQFVADP